LQERDDILINALRAAEESAHKILRRYLGGRASSYIILLKVEEDPKSGELRLTIDIEASKNKAEWIKDLVEEAVNEAAREFSRHIRAARKTGGGG